MIFLDFETRSRLPLREHGVSRYARHESTEVLCMAYKIDDDETRLWWPLEGHGCPFDPAGQRLFAHNATFERYIWQYVCRPKYGWPPVCGTQWYCTAAHCAEYALPRSLEGAGNALGLATRKDKEGHRLMLKLCKPRRPSKNNSAEWHAGAEELQRLGDYCARDVDSDRAIYDVLPPARIQEREVWLLDQKINDRGIPVDVGTATAAIALLNEYANTLHVELYTLTGGRVKTAKQRDLLLSWLNDWGLNIGDVRAATVEACLADDSIQGDARRVLEIRRELGRASTAKYQAILDRADADGRIRDAHLYHGAATGRWSGKGFQPQNLPRGSLSVKDVATATACIRTRDPQLLDMVFGSVTTPLASCLRSMVCAGPGKQLLVCDFASIEARVLAWLAGEDWLLGKFRDGGDIYIAMASRIYGVAEEEVTKQQRHIGKVACLGLGYGMGSEKFRATCEAYGITIDTEFSESVVRTYRAVNKCITQWWRDLNTAALSTVLTGATNVSRVKYYIDGRFLLCELPSGRRLAYCDPRVDEVYTPFGLRPQLSYMSANSFTRKWERTRTYGGKLAENIVQAVARDFQAAAIVRLEGNAYPVIIHAHDEAVCELPVGVGSVREMEAIMCELPLWGEGCPIAVAGFEAERYRK